jgi:hypothetical protein
MARLNVRPPPGPSCKIATKITPPCPPASRLYVLGSADQIVVGRSGRSGPIMAQSNVRPTQEASRKKQPLAKSPLWVFVRPVPIYLIFGPHLRQPSTFSPSMASVRTHQKQNCSHFYIASSRVSLSPFLSLVQIPAQYLQFQMHAITHSLARWAPSASKSRVRRQPYNTIPSTSTSTSAPRSPVASYLHTPPTSVLPSPASQAPACDIEHLSQPTFTNKDSLTLKNKYALGLVGESTPPFLYNSVFFTTQRLRQTKLSNLYAKYGALKISLCSHFI